MTPAVVRQYIVDAANTRGDRSDQWRAGVANTEGGMRRNARSATSWRTFRTAGLSFWPFQLHYGGVGTPYAMWAATPSLAWATTSPRPRGWQAGHPNGWRMAIGSFGARYGPRAIRLGSRPVRPGAAEGAASAKGPASSGTRSAAGPGCNGPELAWLGERGPEYVVSNAALRGGGTAAPLQSVSMPIVIGDRVIEEWWISGRDLAIRRGRMHGAPA